MAMPAKVVVKPRATIVGHHAADAGSPPLCFILPIVQPRPQNRILDHGDCIGETIFREHPDGRRVLFGENVPHQNQESPMIERRLEVTHRLARLSPGRQGGDRARPDAPARGFPNAA
jgi:hypothetical protein